MKTHMKSTKDQQQVYTKKVERIISGYKVTILYSEAHPYNAIERVRKLLMESVTEDSLASIHNPKEGIQP